MLLAAEMGPAAARSSMERMLDSIRLRDEQPEDVPPALPARPTLRGRLPSSKRLLPVQFKPVSEEPELLLIGSQKRVEEKELVFSSKVFGSGRMVKVEGPDEAPCAEMPELQSYEERLEEADGSGSPAVSSLSSVSPDAKLGWGETTDNVLNKTVALEGARNQTLQRILWLQKHFRGLQARRSFQELKKGVTTLQSFVRGQRLRCEFESMRKRWKAVVVIQKHVRRQIARKSYYNQQKDIILLQAVIRGWLARRHFEVLKNLEMPKLNHVKVNRGPSKSLPVIKDTNKENPSVLAELQRSVLQAEAALIRKEEENIMLQHKLQQYETRCSEYEAKMKSLEETWQKQLTSLRMSLAAAKKSLVADDKASDRSGWFDASPNHHSFDSEDTSAETRTPEGTPAKQPLASDARSSRNSDGTKNAVSNLVEEFEQRSRIFEDDAGFLMEEKSGKPSPTKKTDEELRKLKVRFATWKKDYNVRLRDTMVAVQKLSNSESDKARKRWWSTSCTR